MMIESRPLEEIDYPKTRDEWWMLLDNHLLAIRDIVAAYHPGYQRRYAKPHTITAPAAEMVRRSIALDIEAETKKDPVMEFDRMVKERDLDLVTMLNQAWFGMPESYESRAESGFGTLCDLCSEAYVLNDEGLAS